MKRVNEMTDLELSKKFSEIEENLKSLGKEFDETSPNSFQLIDGEAYSHRDQLNCEILSCYSAMGSILVEMDKRGMSRPV